jgi:hypothetical protein
MADDRNEDLAELRRMNARLDESLKRCRALLSECKSKLAANANEPDLPSDESKLG